MRVSVVGHPFIPIGMGEQMRSFIRALSLVQVECEIVDVYQWAPRSDPAYTRLIGERESDVPTADICIFHLNGDEVEPSVAALEKRGFRFADHTNIIMPAWELPVYPEIWAPLIGRFHARWAISRFVAASIQAAGLDAVFIGQSGEVKRESFLPRRHFGIRETAFVLFHFFDTSSYVARKNPSAAIEMFRSLRTTRPYDDIQLVLKVKGEEGAGELLESLHLSPDDVVIITEQLSTFETMSLVRGCDAFVSLHRSEGYGRGLSEAMSLGRLAVGTAWSGNLDFMTADNSVLVDYELVAVNDGEYPHGAGNRWAEADPLDAARKLRKLIDSPADYRTTVARAARDVLRTTGDRAVGMRALHQLKALQETGA